MQQGCPLRLLTIFRMPGLPSTCALNSRKWATSFQFSVVEDPVCSAGSPGGERKGFPTNKVSNGSHFCVVCRFC